jgi:UDP-N-acetylglucosamine--N-acetylmuramyl-(pentapeptide) pyrophosphoryl-undecaprenol N-acetylglucosamine transferase
MKFLFACGGTAGHINPAIALADELRRTVPDSRILFVGSGRRLENKLIPEAGYTIENITVSGFERGISPNKLVRNIKTIRNLTTAAAQSEAIIGRFKPDAVIGTGGYVCYPVLKKAARKGIPTFVHESNAIPGLTTKMLSGIVNKVLVAFPDVEHYYKHPDKIIFTGTPVRAGFIPQNKNDARLLLGIDGRPLVVSFWGSLGAERMNEIIADFMALNMSSKLFNHIHATGGSEAVTEALIRRVRDKSASGHIPQWVDIRTYIYNMPSVMAASDLVLCRAGASTIAELTYMGKPAILVPSPYVTNNHQEKNALQLGRTGGAIVISEKECTGEILYQKTASLLKNKDELSVMSDAMKGAGVPDSAKKIAELIISMC